MVILGLSLVNYLLCLCSGPTIPCPSDRIYTNNQQALPSILTTHWQYLTKVAAMQSTQAVSARLLRGHGGPVEVVADLPVDVRAHKVIVVGRFAFERHAAQLTAEAHVGVVVLGLFRVDRGSG